jgi:hypothetical protein
MSGIALVPGCILHWEGFKFRDGEEANKFFVIVGAKADCNYLAIIATSVPKNKSFEAGGHPEDGYYHIPGGGRDWFPKNTWLLFSEPREIAPSELLKFVWTKTITVKGHLRPEVANAICNCMRKCQDVSEYHASLLGPPLSTAKK